MMVWLFLLAWLVDTEINIEMARNLVLMALPAHIVYLFVTVSVQGNTALTTSFLLCYLGAALLQVSDIIIVIIIVPNAK